MTEHRRLLSRAWFVPAGVVVLIAGHAMLPYLLARAGLAGTVVSGVIVLVVLQHLGFFGALYALFRRRVRPSKRGDGNAVVRSPDSR